MRVEELLNRKKLRYKRSGQDFLIKCLNPDHEDSNPSMRVDTVLGIFNCLACGYSGNLFKEFNENSDPGEIKKEVLRRKIASIRGSTIGLDMPEDCSPFMGEYRGIGQETYRYFEAFRTSEMGMQGRLVFPIRGPDGRIVVFQGRDLYGTEKSKYLNYPPKTRVPLFPTVLPIKGRVLLVEGIFDMLNLHDKGLTNAVSCFGIETIKDECLENFKLQEVTGIDVVFDGDDAGARAAPKVKERLTNMGFLTRTITLKGGQDPGELSPAEVLKLKRTLYD